MGTRVFTFYAGVKGKAEAEERALIEVWAASWRARGWEPKVLEQADIRMDTEAERAVARLRRLPSQNRANLDLWCYLRWLAVAQQGGGFMADYDVINYGFAPREVGELTTHERFVPCLVSGTAEEFRRAFGWFLESRVPWMDRLRGGAHISDMLILRDRGAEFVQRGDCVEHGFADWEKAAAVHFSNGSMKPRDYMPRHEWIGKLRAWA